MAYPKVLPWPYKSRFEYWRAVICGGITMVVLIIVMPPLILGLFHKSKPYNTKVSTPQPHWYKWMWKHHTTQ